MAKVGKHETGLLAIVAIVVVIGLIAALTGLLKPSTDETFGGEAYRTSAVKGDVKYVNEPVKTPIKEVKFVLPTDMSYADKKKAASVEQQLSQYASAYEESVSDEYILPVEPGDGPMPAGGILDYELNLDINPVQIYLEPLREDCAILTQEVFDEAGTDAFLYLTWGCVELADNLNLSYYTLSLRGNFDFSCEYNHIIHNSASGLIIENDVNIENCILDGPSYNGEETMEDGVSVLLVDNATATNIIVNGGSMGFYLQDDSHLTSGHVYGAYNGIFAADSTVVQYSSVQNSFWVGMVALDEADIYYSNVTFPDCIGAGADYGGELHEVFVKGLTGECGDEDETSPIPPTGFYMDGEFSQIDNSIANEGNGYGFTLESGNCISCTATENIDGFWMKRGSRCDYCDASYNNAYGFIMEDYSYVETSEASNNYGGFSLFETAYAIDVEANNNNVEGFLLFDGSVVVDGSAGGNAFGFHLYDFSTVQLSQSGEGSFGFVGEDQTTQIINSTSYSDMYGFTSEGEVFDCEAQASTIAGFHIYDEGIVSRSLADYSTGDGFLLVQEATGINLIANNNQGIGIYVDQDASLLNGYGACNNGQSDIFVNFGFINGNFVTTDGTLDGAGTGNPIVTTCG
jgi:hypothetical protein